LLTALALLLRVLLPRFLLFLLPRPLRALIAILIVSHLRSSRDGFPLPEMNTFWPFCVPQNLGSVGLSFANIAATARPR